MGREDVPLGGPGVSALADEVDWGAPVVDAAAELSAPRAGQSLSGRASPRDAPGGDATPDLEPTAFAPLEWEPGGAPSPSTGNPAAVARADGAQTPPSSAASVSHFLPQPIDFVAHRIRERYFRARFPEVEPPSSPANADPGAVIRAARLYFEDGDIERAAELLQLAAEILPREDRLLLAKLEIHFLALDASSFAATARLFEGRFPTSPDLPRVHRLGQRLQAEAQPAGGAVADDRYGAWPEIANWIEAPWDLTSEVLAVELRGRLLAMPVASDLTGGA